MHGSSHTIAILGTVVAATALTLLTQRRAHRRLEALITATLAANRRDYLAARDAIDRLAARLCPMTVGEEALRDLMQEARERQAAPSAAPTPLRGRG